MRSTMQAEPAGPRKHKRGSETRARPHQVDVRLSPAEHALVEAEARRSGKSPPSVLREAFLASMKVEVQP